MSEPNQININSLHHTVLRETEDDSLLEIDPNFYRNLSDFIGNLRKQEFDGVENKIKDTLIEMTTELTSLLLKIRLDKISKSPNFEILSNRISINNDVNSVAISIIVFLILFSTPSNSCFFKFPIKSERFL